MKCIMLCCKFSLNQWRKSPRIICVFILLAVYIFFITRPLANFSSEVGIKCGPWIFPFITADKNTILILMSLYITLLCDVPSHDAIQKYVIIRVGKVKWMLGQFLYIAVSTVIYWSFIAFVSVLSLLPNLSLISDWGKVLTTLANDPSFIQNPYFFILKKIVILLSPLKASVLSFLLAFMTCFFVGSVVIFFNLSKQRYLGTFISFTMVMLQHFAYLASGYWVFNISPISWISLNIVDFRNTNTSMPGLTRVVIILCALNIILPILSIIKIKRHAVDLVRM